MNININGSHNYSYWKWIDHISSETYKTVRTTHGFTLAQELYAYEIPQRWHMKGAPGTSLAVVQFLTCAYLKNSPSLGDMLVPCHPALQFLLFLSMKIVSVLVFTIKNVLFSFIGTFTWQISLNQNMFPFWYIYPLTLNIPRQKYTMDF